MWKADTHYVKMSAMKKTNNGLIMEGTSQDYVKKASLERRKSL